MSRMEQHTIVRLGTQSRGEKLTLAPSDGVLVLPKDDILPKQLLAVLPPDAHEPREKDEIILKLW